MARTEEGRGGRIEDGRRCQEIYLSSAMQISFVFWRDSLVVL